MSEPSIEELFTDIARILVDKPEGVLVVASADERGTILRIKVHPTDVGKIIGKQGRTARSIRTILGAISVKVDKRYYLEIVEDRDPAPEKK
jgi:uncharacterized protein